MRKTFIALALAGWWLFAFIWGASSPEGGCASQPGGCTVTPQTDEGLGMDPDGKPGS